MLHFQRGVEVIKQDGLNEFIRRGIRYVSLPFWNTISSRYPIGTNVFEKDWDLLIVLDACRVDSFRTVAESIEWIDNIGQIRSVGSMSAEWMLNTFRQKYADKIQRTTYISENIWASRIFEDRLHDSDGHYSEIIQRGYPAWHPVIADKFGHLETLASESDQYEPLHPKGHLPHVVTDRAISMSREQSPDRMVVHYMLPHGPFITEDLLWEPNQMSIEELMAGPGIKQDARLDRLTLQPVKKGKVDVKTIYNLYLDNIRLALEYVKILLENIDAETVFITADHGEGFGEHGVWNHPFGYPFSPIRTVPWATTTANNKRTYTPQYNELNKSINNEARDKFLQNMGYM